MKKFFLLVSISTFLIACGGDDSEVNSDGITVDDGDTLMEAENEIPIDISLNKITSFPKECEITGTMVDAYSWNDANGINYFIRTHGDVVESESPEDFIETIATQYLYAYHYVENTKGEISLLKETTDFEKNCEFDLKVSHELDAISLTDLDEDEIGEITFIYRLSCASDVSPSTQKLIMLENGNKYPLRGTTEVMGYGGEFEAGKEFNEAPASFLAHAEEMWSENLAEYDFDL